MFGALKRAVDSPNQLGSRQVPSRLVRRDHVMTAIRGRHHRTAARHRGQQAVLAGDTELATHGNADRRSRGTHTVVCLEFGDFGLQ